MATVVTGNLAKFLWPGIESMYGLAEKMHKEEWRELYDVRTSKKNAEEIVGIVPIGTMQVKDETDAVVFDRIRQGFTHRKQHSTYALGISISRETVEDEMYNVVAKAKTASLARAVALTKETLAVLPYNRAFDNNYTGADGLELCSTAHLNISGGTFANELATAADLSPAALEQSYIDIGGWTDDKGNPMAAMPRKLIIPRQLQFDAVEILKSEKEIDGNNNNINSVREVNVVPEGIRVNHYLSDPDAWFLMTDVTDGMVAYMRREPEFTIDNDFDTENAKFKATMRCSFTWARPKGLFGSPGV